MGDARSLSRIDCSAVLGDTLPDLGTRHQHQLVCAGECGGERLSLVVVDAGDADASRLQVGEFVEVATTRDDIGGRDTVPEKGFDDETTEMSGSTGDNN
jgi:hypothetical protein